MKAETVVPILVAALLLHVPLVLALGVVVLALLAPRPRRASGESLADRPRRRFSLTRCPRPHAAAARTVQRTTLGSAVSRRSSSRPARPAESTMASSRCSSSWRFRASSARRFGRSTDDTASPSYGRRGPRTSDFGGYVTQPREKAVDGVESHAEEEPDGQQEEEESGAVRGEHHQAADGHRADDRGQRDRVRGDARAGEAPDQRAQEALEARLEMTDGIGVSAARRGGRARAPGARRPSPAGPQSARRTRTRCATRSAGRAGSWRARPCG